MAGGCVDEAAADAAIGPTALRLFCRLCLEDLAGRWVNPDRVATDAIGYDKIVFNPYFDKAVGRLSCRKLGCPLDLPIFAKTNEIMFLFRVGLGLEDNHLARAVGQVDRFGNLFHQCAAVLTTFPGCCAACDHALLIRGP